MSNYGTDFIDKLNKNFALLEDKLTTDAENHLTQNSENNKWWIEALRLTFLDMGNIGAALGIGASCDLTGVVGKLKPKK